MDYPLPVVCDDGDLPWSDHCSMDSDDEHDMILNQSPRWINSFSPSASASASASACSSAASLSASLTLTASHMSHAGQLSPISTSMDVTMLGDGNSCPPSASTAPAMIHSASSSSCADSWSIKFSDSEDFSSTGDNNSNNNDIHWEQGSDDVLTVPKLEPMDDDDDFRLDDVKEAPMTPVPSNSALTPVETKVKRPRGRPRKHPIAPPVNTNKVTKGRSKTGCITCRKRKKKCDEAKPRCMNCEKNAVVCEGYPEKQIWKSGRERAEEALMKAGTLPRVTMQPIFLGLETLEDHIFWKHYNDHLSAVLTVEGEHKNGFKMLVPIATKHQGLMHAILALAAAHLDLDTPYGINMLRKHPNTTIQALEQRSQFHRDQAMAVLIKGIGDCENDRDPDVSLSARYGQILCLLLENSVQGTQNGEHRVHLDAYQKLMASSPPQDPAFRVFITEFFQYRVFADELTRFPREHRPRLACETWTSPVLIEPPRLLGVADGLFSILSRITTIRNRIRDNMASQEDPIVDYNILCQAADIQEAIQAWSPPWPPGDSRNHVGPLYQQMIWMYLFRTIFPPSPSSTTASAASSSASLVSNPVPVNHPLASSTSSSLPFSAVPAAAAATGGLPHGSNSISISNVHTPPKSASTSCSPSPHLRPNSAGNHDQRQHCALPPPHSPRRHSIAVPLSSTSMTSSSVILTTHTAASESGDSHHNDHHHHLNSTNNANHEHRAESPPPIRQPPLDNRITVAVEESLEILESFKPSDPAQTLLLIPCLVIGVTCFSPHQQRRVRNAVRHVRGYTGLKNTDRVMELLEEVWRLMNQGQWASVWDWQGVAEGMGIDFPCA